MIYFVNGVWNSKEDAEGTAEVLNEISGKELKIFNNEEVGKVKDLAKVVDGYTLEQVILANTLVNISKDGSYVDNLIIPHSRGNADVNKAIDILHMTGENLGYNVSMINVATPEITVGQDKITSKAYEVGINVLGQYKDPRDIVGWSYLDWAKRVGLGVAAGAVLGTLGTVGVAIGSTAISEGVGPKIDLAKGMIQNIPNLSQSISNLSKGLNTAGKILSNIGTISEIGAGLGGALAIGKGFLDVSISHPINDYLNENSKVLDTKSTGSTGNNLYKDLKNLDKNINLVRDKNLAKIKAKNFS